MELASPNPIFKFWRQLVFVCLAGFLGISSASGCSDILLFFSVLFIGSLVLPFVIWKTKKSTMPLAALIDRFVSTAALLFLGSIFVAGAIGMYQGEAFMTAACSSAITAARFATTMLKFVAHAL
jgi:phosphoglycerol transferase MdoB-like AlkP superfamily enzyme